MHSLKRAMKRFVVLVFALWVGLSPSLSAIEYDKKYYVPFRDDSLEHFGLGAGTTFLGSQVLQFWGVTLGPAVTVSALGSIGLNFYKEYVYDLKPGVNDLIAGTIGTIIGTIAA